jgi:hypothetical protein
MFEEKMSSPKTPKTPQRRRLSLKEKIKIMEDSKKPGFDKAKIMKEYGISRLTVINVLKNQFETLKAVDSGIMNDCDETLCVKCFKAHSRLKLTRTHIVTHL